MKSNNNNKQLILTEMKKHITSEEAGPFNIEPRKPPSERPGPMFKGMQRPIKIKKPAPEVPESPTEETDQWVRNITEKAKNPQFNQVIDILKNDKELEPLLYDHKELLETLSGMRMLNSKQMLSILSAAEKEYYESSHPERAKSDEIPEEFIKKLEEEAHRRREAEEALTELRQTQPSESDTVALKTMNQNLLDENRELTKLLSEQSKYLKEVENLQKDLLNAQSQKLSAVKSKEKLEEGFEKNKKMIDDLKQEISLLQQEKDNLTRKLASTIRSQLGSTVPGRRIITTKFNTPLRELEESKMGKPTSSTGQRKGFRRSRSFDSSLKYNRDLAALLMESREERVEPVHLVEISRGDLVESRERYSTQPHHEGPTMYSSMHPTKHEEQFAMSAISPGLPSTTKIREQPQTSKKEGLSSNTKITPSMEEKKGLEQTLEKENLHSIIKDLQQENQSLTCKVQEMERRFQQAIGKPSIFGADISRIAPTFAGATPTQDRLFLDQQTPVRGYLSSGKDKGTSTKGKEVDKYADIFNMLEDVGDTLKIRLPELIYDKGKGPLENIRDYIKTLKEQVVEKEQTRELESALLEGKRLREKARQWRNEIERLETELRTLQEENETLKMQKHHAEKAKIHSELTSSQAQYAAKLRDENLELMGKYEAVMNENYELRLKLRNAMASAEKSYKSSVIETTVQPNALVGQFADYKIKLEEQLFREKEKSAKLAEGIAGLKERNELLKEELSLQREKNRQLEREMMRYVKKATNLSQEATVNKHNYKSIAANHAQLANTLKKLQKENKTLKDQIRTNQSNIC